MQDWAMYVTSIDQCYLLSSMLRAWRFENMIDIPRNSLCHGIQLNIHFAFNVQQNRSGINRVTHALIMQRMP